ncbi:MAG: DUF4214 domain-containing protein [Acidimicrobiales bacterium]
MRVEPTATFSGAPPPHRRHRARGRRLRRMTVGCLALASTAAVVPLPSLTAPAGAAPSIAADGTLVGGEYTAPMTADAVAGAPASAGAWGPVESWPLIGIHAALDRDGRVVTYGTTAEGKQSGYFLYDVWTPNASAAEGHRTLPNRTGTDVFCSLQINRYDTGEMLTFGGDNWTGTATTNTGNPDINSYDPATGQLTKIKGMLRARWYATATTLGDGSILVQGGDGGWDHPERWSPERGSELVGADLSPYFWWYPKAFVLPDGRLFSIDVFGRMYVMPADLSTATPVGRLPEHRQGFGATAVMFAPGRILHFGGETNTSVIIDVTGTTPVVTPGPALSSARRWVNGTLLPDGRILATGGATIAGMGTADNIGAYQINNAAEVFDPRTGTWTVEAAGSNVARMYHSTAILLPDGRVLVGGGGAPGPETNLNAELFTPDYLLNGDGTQVTRPTIGSVSATDLTPGQTITLDATSASGVSRVTMLKAGAVTHSFNMEQHLVELPIETRAGANGTTAVSATLPLNENHLIPGFYLLTVLDGNGVPSESTMVRVTPPLATRPMASVDGQVVRLYRAFFQRQPDEAGYRYWRRLLLTGGSLHSIADAFAASPELIARYGELDDAAFVDQVYRNVLGRAAEPEGRAFWLGQLYAGMSRGRMMTEFSESAEFVALTGTPAPSTATPFLGAPLTDASPLAGAVTRLYLGYFARLPDDAGLAYWVGQRQAGVPLSQISAVFARSDEFQQRYGGTTDVDFIVLVYQHVLERLPDDVGLAFWAQELARGLGRGDLMLQFTESAEFVGRVTPQG